MYSGTKDNRPMSEVIAAARGLGRGECTSAENCGSLPRSVSCTRKVILLGCQPESKVLLSDYQIFIIISVVDDTHGWGRRQPQFFLLFCCGLRARWVRFPLFSRAVHRRGRLPPRHPTELQALCVPMRVCCACRCARAVRARARKPT